MRDAAALVGGSESSRREGGTRSVPDPLPESAHCASVHVLMLENVPVCVRGVAGSHPHWEECCCFLSIVVTSCPSPNQHQDTPHTCMCALTYICTHVQMHTHACVHTQMCTHMHMHTYRCAHSCMCIHKCVLICICAHAYAHICTNVYMHLHAHVYVHTCINVRARAYACKYLHTCMCALACVQMCVYVDICAYAHVCINVCTHMCTDARMPTQTLTHTFINFLCLEPATCPGSSMEGPPHPVHISQHGVLFTVQTQGLPQTASRDWSPWRFSYTPSLALRIFCLVQLFKQTAHLPTG